MREIKFRAWDKDSKEMIPLFNIDFEHNIMNKGSLWKSLYSVELLQYTWLKDKNGKEIYEGDLVEYCIEWGYWNNDYTIKRTVEYKEWHYNPFIHWHEEFTQKTYPECCEVIGNIYENPELVTI